MPGSFYGVNISAIAYTQELKVAFKASRFIDQMAKVIKEDATYQNSEGTQRDPTYIIRDKDGKVRRFWQTKEDQERIEKFKKYEKILCEGLDFLKPAWYSARMYVDDAMQSFYQAYNFLTLISEAFTDLTCGGGVHIETGIEEMDSLLNEDLKMGQRLYEWLFEASVFGYVGIQLMCDWEAGVLEMQRILPEYLYVYMGKHKDNVPVCISKKIPIAKEEISDWEKITKAETSDGIELNQKDVSGFVYEERHFRGMFERFLWAVKGEEIITRIPLRYYMPDVSDVQLTGLQGFAITILPNQIRMGRYISDWDNILGINLAFNDRASRTGESLNMFNEPTLLIGENQATYDPATGKTFYRKPRMGVMVVRPHDKFKPEYIQPSLDNNSNQDNLKFLMNMLSTHAQASALLIDPDAASAVESGVAYKLKMSPTLKKVNRSRPYKEMAVAELVFNVLSAVNFYYEKNLVRKKLQDGISSADAEYAKRCNESMTRLDSGAIQISLDSFDEVFANIEVMRNNPRGIFVQDPTTAQTPEELQYLADEGLLNYIDVKEREMQELKRFREIKIDMQPALPQDIAQAIDRLGQQQSMSLKRLLMEVDGMTEEQADEEIERIVNEEHARSAPAQLNGSGVAFPDLKPMVTENTQDDSLSAATVPQAGATAGDIFNDTEQDTL